MAVDGVGDGDVGSKGIASSSRGVVEVAPGAAGRSHRRHGGRSARRLGSIKHGADVVATQVGMRVLYMPDYAMGVLVKSRHMQ